MAIKSVTNETIAEMVAAQKPEVKVEPEPKVEQGEPQEAKVKKPIQERISELTAQKRELEEFAQSEYEARLQAQRRISELEALTPKKEAPEDKRPDRASYKPEDAEKYENDLLAWNRREAIKEFTAQEQQRRIQEALTTRIQNAKTDLPDFDEVIERAAKRQEQFPGHIQAALIESELGPHLAYHLEKNPADRKRILSMPPASALLALGKLELSIAKPKADEVKVTQPTKPPPEAPMPSLAGAGAVITTPDKAPDFQTYKRLRLEQMRARR